MRSRIAALFAEPEALVASPEIGGEAFQQSIAQLRLAFAAPPGTSCGMAETQQALARAQLADIQATAANHVADCQAAAAARGEASVQAAKLAETLPLLDEQIAANEQLLAKGFVSKLKVRVDQGNQEVD